MVEKVLRIWNHVELSINGEVITTSGFAKYILEVTNTSIGVAIVERMTRIWNHVEMSINGEIITTSGFAEVIFGGPVGVGMVEKVTRIWNVV